MELPLRVVTINVMLMDWAIFNVAVLLMRMNGGICATKTRHADRVYTNAPMDIVKENHLMEYAV